MDRATVQAHLITTLRAIQADAGEECPDIGEATIPVRDLPGFDSLAGVDAEVRLSEILGVEVDRIRFHGDARELTVAEIVDEVCGALLGDKREG